MLIEIQKRLRGTPPTRCFPSDRSGAAAVEFAMLAPVLFLLLIGTFQFGILINNYIQLTEAVRVGGRTLAISRGSTTPITATKNAFYGSAPSLTPNALTFTMTVNGNGCNGTTSDSTCAGYLTAAQGQQATLTVDYNCTNLIVYGTNFLPNCKLSSTTNIRIE